jgi:hypothetical protein
MFAGATSRTPEFAGSSAAAGRPGEARPQTAQQAPVRATRPADDDLDVPDFLK